MDTKTKAIDPVCGMTVDPATAAGSSDFGGRTHWFCSTGCKRAFDADPAKYTTASTGAMGDAHPDAHHPPAAPQPMVQLGMNAARSTTPPAQPVVQLSMGAPKCAETAPADG